MTEHKQLIVAAWVFVVLNTALMSLLTYIFSGPTFIGHGREIWFSGSIGLLVLGAIIPGLALAYYARRSSNIATFITCWLIASFFAAWLFGGLASGGV
jgi:uncharacterized membrane protein YGL010W